MGQKPILFTVSVLSEVVVIRQGEGRGRRIVERDKLDRIICLVVVE